MKLSYSPHPYDTCDVPKVSMTDTDFHEKRPYELTISVKSTNEKDHLYPVANTGELVSPPQSAASSTLV